ncbi:DUF4349 domain-containing protein [Candidatus Woesearchaeota archaeon]|nr:DUF4349 domain-containing protein [Candidatus Woesearchaeota archaeon]
MSFKEQLIKLKENWLLAVLVIAVLLFASFVGNNSFGSIGALEKNYGGMYAETSMAVPSAKMGYGGDNSFAPEVQERKITKNTWMSSEVRRGEFKSAEEQLKNIVKSTDSYLLNENTNLYGSGKTAYYSGSYQIKVDTQKYDSIVSQLKQIGEVTSFNENAADITERYTDLKSELEAEQERLKKYNEMYAEANDINDKILLADKTFNQERTVKYLQEALKNVNQKVDYSTINVNLNEKQSNYANIVLVSFGQLVRSLVDSFNSLLELVFVILPWAVGAALIWGIVWWVRRKR